MEEKQEQTRYEHVYLLYSGSIPGIPGQHGVGSYVIDWQERTVHPALSIDEYLASLTPPALPEEEQPEQESSRAGEQQPETPPAQEPVQPVDNLSSLLSMH